MMDLLPPIDGKDLRLSDTVAQKAGNVLSVQQGSLEYAPDFGSDLEFFLSENFEFQDESFKAYLVQRLAQHYIDVSSVSETLERFFKTFSFSVRASENSTGLIS